MDREMRSLLCEMLDDLSVRRNKEVEREVLLRAKGQCEGHDYDGYRCSAAIEDCSFRIAREYGYSDEVDYGPLSAKWVALLCDECYENSEDGQREAYEQWQAEQD